MRDWHEWHREYDEAGSNLARRLEAAQGLIREALDRTAAGPVRVVSMCAGQGRDIIGVLRDHPRRDDVSARLVELDPRNSEIAREAANRAGLGKVEVVTGDAGWSDAYALAVPADVVLACGIFGNVPDGDIANTIDHLPELCAPAATVIWTRHRRPPDATPAIRRRFAAAGFDELAFVAPDDALFSVGAHRLAREPAALAPGTRYFSFVTGEGRAWSDC